jgi:flagellar hook-basal body complex protein FliE
MPDPIITRNVLESHRHIYDGLLKDVPNREPFKSQPLSQIPFDRYTNIFYGADNEEKYARTQSGWDQLANGIVKTIGTFASSFMTGTVGLINGIGQMASTGRAASFYDNEFNRTFDDFNKYLEDAFPNYYTHAEKDAAWYSPTNIFSANFLGDKVLKNLGYSAGALVGGMGWGAALKGVGLTAKLVRAGKGLQAIEATEAVMANTPRLQQLGAINKSLTSLWNGTKGTVGKGLMNTDRAIVSVMGTMGEASIEAMNASNNFRNKLLEDYKDVYGVAPTKEALAEINSYADKVGNNIFAANVALLTATNYIQLPKILGSSKTLEKRVINSIEKEAVGGTAEAAGKGASKWVAGTPTTGNILSPIVSKLGKPGRFIDKYVLGPGRLTFSAAEAFEEGAQYSIETGVEDYFDRAYKHKDDADQLLGGIGDVLGSIFTEGVRKTLTSKEGMESILIGGLSG